MESTTCIKFKLKHKYFGAWFLTKKQKNKVGHGLEMPSCCLLMADGIEEQLCFFSFFFCQIGEHGLVLGVL